MAVTARYPDPRPGETTYPLLFYLLIVTNPFYSIQLAKVIMANTCDLVNYFIIAS